jgi:hypothetical protein
MLICIQTKPITKLCIDLPTEPTLRWYCTAIYHWLNDCAVTPAIHLMLIPYCHIPLTNDSAVMPAITTNDRACMPTIYKLDNRHINMPATWIDKTPCWYACGINLIMTVLLRLQPEQPIVPICLRLTDRLIDKLYTWLLSLPEQTFAASTCS